MSEQKIFQCRSSELSIRASIEEGEWSEKDHRIFNFLAFDEPQDAFDWLQVSGAFCENAA